jgi:RHS repeat-associated protein
VYTNPTNTPLTLTLAISTDKPTYFDELDLQITQQQQNIIIQENNYYAFGLNLHGTEYTNGQEHRWQYNEGTEKLTDFDLWWIETQHRSFDPAICVFRQVDKLAELFAGTSPFVFAFNNPINFNDPTGLAPTPTLEELEKLAEKYACTATRLYDDIERLTAPKLPEVKTLQINPNRDFKKFAERAEEVVAKSFQVVEKSYDILKDGADLLLTSLTLGGKILIKYTATEIPNAIIKALTPWIAVQDGSLGYQKLVYNGNGFVAVADYSDLGDVKRLTIEFLNDTGGDITMQCDVEVIGKDIRLYDVNVLPESGTMDDHSQVRALNGRPIFERRNAIKSWAKSQGFERLRIQGNRALESSSAKKGKLVDTGWIKL